MRIGNVGTLITPALLLLVSARPAAAQSCGEIGGDYCSQSGSCPGGYNDLGPTYDCNPCCQQASSGPSCGEIGGDLCSQNGSCPAGYSSLGWTYDCNPCCQQSGPSCGALGGDYCSHNGGCPSGYDSLGQTYDCSPCCRHVDTGPSCTSLGGNYCSHSGSCPTSYRSLGQTYDCSPCCQQLSGPAMTGSVYTYSASGTDFSILWGRGITDSDYNTYGHQYRETTTIRSPRGRTATASGSRSTSHSEVTVTLPVDPNDLGQYDIETQHFEFCPYVDLEWSIGWTFSRPHLGVAASCWDWFPHVVDTDIWGHIRCKYNTLRVPCTAECIPPAGVPTYHQADNGYCPEILRWDVLFIIWPDGSRNCAPAGEGFPSDPSCQCGNIIG